MKGRTDTNRSCLVDADTLVLPKLGESLKELFSKKSHEGVGDSLLEEIKAAKLKSEAANLEGIQKGDFILARVQDVTTKTLFAEPLAKSSISEFFALSRGRPCFE